MGPLNGIKVIEIASLGPGPFTGMLLANMGADIIQIRRPAHHGIGSMIPEEFDYLNQGRKILSLDLKDSNARALVLALCQKAELLFEGFRPGAMEKLGLGPQECLKANPALVYGRLTGWGQTGPLAHTAGHDVNYLSLSGVLGHLGREGEPPAAPLNLLADFAGGSLSLIMGMLAALLNARTTQQGQIVDAAMIDGASQLMTLFYGLKGAGLWQDKRGQNMFDGGCYFYNVFETSDGAFMAVGPLEPKFYQQFITLLGQENTDLAMQNPPHRWADLTEKLQMIFTSKTAAQWESIFDGSDACVTRVLDMTSAPIHTHNKARQAYIGSGKATRPAPAPRFSRTASKVSIKNETNADNILSAWRIEDKDISAFRNGTPSDKPPTSM